MLSVVDYRPWYSLTIKKWIFVVKPYINETYGEFLYKNLKKHELLGQEHFFMRTLHVGKFNIILMEILVGFQKANFLHARTLCLPNTVYDTKMNW